MNGLTISVKPNSKNNSSYDTSIWNPLLLAIAQNNMNIVKLIFDEIP